MFESAVHEVADVLPTEFLLNYVASPTNIVNSSGAEVVGNKILLVARNNVPCDRISYEESLMHTAITDSIYERETNSFPAYYLDPVGGTSPNESVLLKVLPVPTAGESAKAYLYSYPTALTFATDTVIANFPVRAYQAVIYKMAVLILASLIKDATINEEDPELLTMYQQQQQIVSEMYTKELIALTGGEEPAGAE